MGVAEWTGELSDEHAHALCAALLPRAVLDAEEQLPTGLLIKEIAKTAIALDPTWAERRYKEALRRKRVVGRPNRDGTADLSGQQLEPHRVAAVCGRLNVLARAAKRDGDSRPIDHLRAELYLGLLDGTYEGLTDAEIFAALAATRPATDHDPEAGEPTPDAAPAPGTAAESEAAAPATPAASARPKSPQAGVQLRIRLTTLLGLDRAPAEIAGWNPVHAGYGVDLTAAMSAAQWRYVLTDDDGRAIGTGLVNTRPRGWRRRSARHQGVVDLLVPASLLRDLVLAPDGPIDLVDPEQYRSWHPVLQELAQRMQHPKPMPDDSDRRFPGRALRRAVELDKQRCIGVGCGRPARRSEMDHTTDWALGGRTTSVNLAPGCGRDHGLKTKGGWKLHAWTPGQYRWCTPLGRHYVVSVPRVIAHVPAARPDFWIEDLTDRPDPDADTDSDGIPWQASQMWHPGGAQPPPTVHIRSADPPRYAEEPPF
ncbi:MAG: HNH endonuclease signature motif containing protein [Sporichthyaceae bacterium]